MMLIADVRGVSRQSNFKFAMRRTAITGMGLNLLSDVTAVFVAKRGASGHLIICSERGPERDCAPIRERTLYSYYLFTLY